MTASSSNDDACPLCGKPNPGFAKEEADLCPDCYGKSEALFDEEMRRVEMIRTLRGRDVELYDIKHPDAGSDQNHCGQAVIIRAGRGFEVKICLRSDALDWMGRLTDADSSFVSRDTRLDALIGNVSLLIESWGGGPYYMDIFEVNKVVSTEGEI